jgi:hypothetical protein
MISWRTIEKLNGRFKTSCQANATQVPWGRVTTPKNLNRMGIPKMTETNQTTQNEITTTENTPTQVTISETDKYMVIKQADGTFKRKAKFADYSSIVATDRAEKIWLMNLLDGDAESGNPLKQHIGKQIEIENVITRKYDKINEETGELEYGVLTYLITPEKVPYATSSKSVYFSITRMMDLFGTPDSEEWENITVKVSSSKGANGDIINIKMVG